MTSCGGGSGGSNSSDATTDSCSQLSLNAKVLNGTACSGLNNSPVVRVVTNFLDGSQGQCTGTMITDDDVLTAVHCFIDFDNLNNIPVSAGILYGESDNLHSADAHTYLVSPLLRFESIAGEDVVFNDFTILQLREKINLPTLPILVSSTPNVSDVVQIYGYGRVSQGTSEELNDNEDLISGETVIRSVTNNHIRTDFQRDHSGTCFGDSGGPLVVMQGNQPTLAGVLSGFVELNGHTADCGEGSISQYTNLQSSELLQSILATVPDAQTY